MAARTKSRKPSTTKSRAARGRAKPKRKPSVKQLEARERFVERQTKGKPKTAAEQRLEARISRRTGKPYKGAR